MQSPISTAADFPPLVFDDVLMIVGGGAVDVSLLGELHARGMRVIAADGGAETCALANIVPEAIVGDLDSVQEVEKWAEKTQIMQITDQETTDFEKCLYATRAPLTLALGMTGKRFDHTLAALDVVSKYANQRRIILIDEEDIALGVVGALSFTVQAGDRVSVHPLREVLFDRSIGLRYPLDGLLLGSGIRSGTSNQAIDGFFLIEPALDAGPWLLILSRIYLIELIDSILGKNSLADPA